MGSDKRWKRDVGLLDGAAMLRGIRETPARRYTKEMPGTAAVRELGLFAQDLQAHFPEQVKADADGYLHVGLLFAPVFAAIAHLADRLEAAGIDVE